MNVVRMLIGIFLICFVCSCVSAQDIVKSNADAAEDREEPLAEELLNEYEALEEEAKADTKEVVVEDTGLKEGTVLDDKTYAKIVQYRRDAEISNLQITAVRLAATKANDGYFNNLKIWLALHGVKEPDLDKWELNGKRVYLKKKK
jgi:hypothetical protein